MRPPSHDASDHEDAWLDGLLLEQAGDHHADYLADDGFTAKVMAALPAPIALPAWRKPAVAVLWAIAGLGLASVLPEAASEAMHDTLRALAGHRFTWHEVLVGIAGLSAATWIGSLYALRRD